jgi:calcineurin-like phosphoesterase family protein
MIWFSADYHLSHKNIIKYCNRPFQNVEEMDSVIIDNLKSRVKPGEILYYLGDLTFKKDVAIEFFNEFEEIEIHYIIGNHDNKEVLQVAEQYCASISHLKDIIIEEQPITLCHYAMRVWNKSHFNAWQLYGHSHGTLQPIGKQYDVGIDNNGFYPINFDDLQKIMEHLPNNFNFIPKERRNRG